MFITRSLCTKNVSSAGKTRNPHHIERVQSRRVCMNPRSQSPSQSVLPEVKPIDPPLEPIVQYIVIRRDLWQDQQWPLGPLIAQACHASIAALWLHREDEEAQNYMSPQSIDHMHKVVLEVKGETQLNNLAAKLTEAGVLHKLWIEEREHFPTALATKPYTKSSVAHHFKKLKLCKAQLS